MFGSFKVEKKMKATPASKATGQNVLSTMRNGKSMRDDVMRNAERNPSSLADLQADIEHKPDPQADGLSSAQSWITAAQNSLLSETARVRVPAAHDKTSELFPVLLETRPPPAKRIKTSKPPENAQSIHDVIHEVVNAADRAKNRLDPDIEECMKNTSNTTRHDGNILNAHPLSQPLLKP